MPSSPYPLRNDPSHSTPHRSTPLISSARRPSADRPATVSWLGAMACVTRYLLPTIHFKPPPLFRRMGPLPCTGYLWLLADVHVSVSGMVQHLGPERTPARSAPRARTSGGATWACRRTGGGALPRSAIGGRRRHARHRVEERAHFYFFSARSPHPHSLKACYLAYPA